MGAIEDKIKQMGYSLPEPFKFPKPNRTGCVVVGSIIYASGHGRNMGGPGVKAKGKVGRELTVEEGYATARAVALSMLASLKQELGDLDRVKRIVKLLGMVNATPEFGEQPEVINGCSDLFVSVFGDRGRHARSAVGMGSLPRGIPVEIEVIVEINTAPARSSAAAATRKSAQKAKRKSAKSKRR